MVKSIIPAAVNQFQNYNLGPPAQVSTANPNTNPPLPYSVNQVKDDLNTQFDENQLLKTIPPRFRRLAQILLKEFNSRANEVTWTPDGSLLIDEVSIPKSNIYVIFPFLFMGKKLHSGIPGLQELLIKIKDMGLDHLIKTKPLSQKSNFKNFATKGTRSKELTGKWWFLG